MAYTKTIWINGEVALSDTNLNHIETGIEDAHDSIDELKSPGNDLLLAIYPVGSIVFNANGVNPSSYIGGTWVAWGSGKVPVGVDTNDTSFDTAEKTGGAKDAVIPYHNHAFTGSALGNHSHGGVVTSVGSEKLDILDGTRERANVVTNVRGVSGSTNAVSAGTPTGTISYAGTSGNAANANLQPYITCYMWKRTA